MGETVLVGQCIDEHVGRSIVGGRVVCKGMAAVLYVGGNTSRGFMFAKAERKLVDIGLVGFEVWVAFPQFVFGLRLNES